MEIYADHQNPIKTDSSEKKTRKYLLLLPLALAAFLLWLYHGTSPIVHWEYGEGMPSADVFCEAEDVGYRSDTDQTDIGAHVVVLQAGHRIFPCLMIVKDTVAPTADPLDLAFPSGYVPTPDEFITNLKDADMVGVSFAEEYDFSPVGEHTVRILLEDASGNQSEVMSTAVVRATLDKVTVEAGSPAPASEAFCAEGFHGTLISEITEDMLRAPGEYSLQVECIENKRVFPSTLVVRDTVPPTGTGQFLILQTGGSAAPESFLSDITDETAVSCSFAVAPDPESRDVQDIVIRMTDLGGNSVEVPAQVLFSDIGAVTVEAKNGLLTGADLGYPDAEPEEFMANVPGTYAIKVSDENGQEQLAMVTLVDTIGPVITQKDGPFYTHHDLAPEQLVSAEDVTGVSLSFVTAPDTGSDQPQTFTVRAVDGAGNETVTDFALTLATDSMPPVLYGVIDRGGYVGEPIVYLQEAYAEDDVDGRVDIVVDSKVILSKKGKYTVTYTATDKSGNTASKKCTYTLVKSSVSEKKLDELTNAVLEKIITPDMVTVEKLKAVFDFVQKQVRYVGNSNKDDWRSEAVRGLTQGKGDCFTFYSVSRALLDELDIPYMTVMRKGGRTRHYWMIVNVGTGWYHFDTLVNHILPYKCFMFTNQELKKMPEYFWRFAEENYPHIETEPFDYFAVVQMEKDGLLP